MPLIPGSHTIKINFAGKSFPISPFKVKVVPFFDAKKYRTHGRGLVPEGVRVKDDTFFIITTKDAGDGQRQLLCHQPGGGVLSVR